ncbi:MAG: hypothetical protein AAGC65_02145 [Mucilaginibacter sp.]|uniref:hypothetical protein n=1 Tax=Mucilaginibacter sp. TaxID=1882438 RepID=UPI0031A3EFA5
MQLKLAKNKPFLKTKGFSTFHIEIFNQILLDKTNRRISIEFGYTIQSHSVVDHSRRVMYKLLALEGLSRADHYSHLKYPRKYLFWWKNLLDKNRDKLYACAKEPKFYIED